MDRKLLTTIAWMALIGLALILLALQMMGRIPGVLAFAVIVPAWLGLAWITRRSRP